MLINNQRYAELACCDYDDELLKDEPIIYSRTHTVKAQFSKLKRFGPCKLITSFSDSVVTQEMADKLPKNVSHWYSNNVECTHPRVHAIPIGFAYIAEREAALHDALSKPMPRNELCYMNFTRWLCKKPNPREGLYERFGGFDWMTTKGGASFISVPASEFYTDLATHKYCISPPGAGPDCHRHWEAIALGCIPIVLRSKALDVLQGFPHLIVDDWGEVTEELLSHHVPLFDNYSDRLHIEYWKDVIQ